MYIILSKVSFNWETAQDKNITKEMHQIKAQMTAQFWEFWQAQLATIDG